jgi:hypothetical protein
MDSIGFANLANNLFINDCWNNRLCFVGQNVNDLPHVEDLLASHD